MTRLSLGRRLILQEYEKLRQSDEFTRVNVVRTVAVRVGYPLDENNYHAFVRRVLAELGLPY